MAAEMTHGAFIGDKAQNGDNNPAKHQHRNPKRMQMNDSGDRILPFEKSNNAVASGGQLPVIVFDLGHTPN